MLHIYLVTEYSGKKDNVTKIQRQMSSTKFHNLINQITVVSNNIKINECVLESTQKNL